MGEITGKAIVISRDTLEIKGWSKAKKKKSRMLGAEMKQVM